MGSTAFTHELHVVPAPGRPRRALLRLSGDVDCAAADDLRRVVAGVLALDQVATVVVDLGGVTFMNCVGLSPLLVAKRHLGERMHVRALPHCVRRLLALTHLTTWLVPSSSREHPAPDIRDACPRDQVEPRLPMPARREAPEARGLHSPGSDPVGASSALYRLVRSRATGRPVRDGVGNYLYVPITDRGPEVGMEPESHASVSLDGGPGHPPRFPS